MKNDLNISIKNTVDGKELLTLIGGKVEGQKGVYKYTSGGVFCIDTKKEYCELTVFMTVSNAPDENGKQQKKLYIDSVHPPECEDAVISNSVIISEYYEKVLLGKINSISPIIFV